MEIKVSAEELRKKKLFVATPMYGGQCAGMFGRSMSDLTSLCIRYGIEMKFYSLFNESLITRARNYCCDEFVRSGYTHMLFIDSDIGFNANDVIAMLALQSDESPYDIIAAPYPKKCISWERIKQAVDKGMADDNAGQLERYVGDYVFNPVMGSGSIPISEPVEVMETGTGFMMMRRKTFEMYDQAYPQYLYKPDHVRTEHFDGTREIMQYFQAEIDGLDYGAFYKKEMQRIKDMRITDSDVLSKEIESVFEKAQEESKKYSKRYLSEDYWFCQNVRKMGGKVWLCPWISLQHVGMYIFGGSLADLAQVGASATADVNQLGKKKA